MNNYIKHFISILGTGLYEPCEYVFKDKKSKETPFVQEALLKMLFDDDYDVKISIFTSEKSEKNNWSSRIYNEVDVKFAERWKTVNSEQVVEGKNKKGLKDVLEKYSNLKSVKIEIGKTEEELWEIFDCLYEQIGEQEEIYLDITHGFRSIPMQALVVLNYARVMKNCKIKGIFYGAFESSSIGNDGKLNSPIFDLNIYNDILLWTSASESFLKDGNSSQIVDRVKEFKVSLADELKKEIKPLEILSENLQNFTEAIDTSRGLVIKKDTKNKKTKSISEASRVVVRSYDNIDNGKFVKMKPIYNLFSKIIDSVSEFDTESNYELGLAVIDWCIKKDMVQQGFTALEETVTTYICNKLGFDDVSEREIVNSSVNAIYQFLINNKVVVSSQEIVDYLKMEENKNVLLYSCSSEEKEEKYMQVVRQVPIKMAQLSKNIKDNRNDINHFGIREDPKTTKKLKENLVEYFNQFKNIAQEWKA
jgi:CRISPR-associated Csx2 family protein